MSYATARTAENGEKNKLLSEDRAVHEWYRFVLSFPPHLVRDYLIEFEAGPQTRVFDPFCGTGTVLVECKKAGIPSVGAEANPMACFASQVKVDWTPEPDGLIEHARLVASEAARVLEREGVEDTPLFALGIAHDGKGLRVLSPEQDKLLLTNSISPRPLHKALTLLETLERHRDERFHRHELLAFAKSIVQSSSNLRFGPEVGVGKAKFDAPVITPWLAGIQAMASDLRQEKTFADVEAEAIRADSRNIAGALAPESVDIVFTSPPYPNEKDYTRTTRLESVLVGFLHTRKDLRALKEGLLRSNTRNVYKDDDDELDAAGYPEVQRIAEEIEARRVALGKTSGFERLYPTVTRRYFGGIARHLAQLRHVLRPGAHLAYVVGDQASYLQVLIPTGERIAEIAESLGYTVKRIDPFRTRLATATRAQLDEEVVVLTWPSSKAEIAQRYRRLPLGAGADQAEESEMPDPSTSGGARGANRYQQILEQIFQSRYQPGMTEVPFERQELARVAQALNIKVPLNLGDIVYSFRYRQDLPASIQSTAPAGQHWVIHSVGRSSYQFTLRPIVRIVPNPSLAETKVPDATPGLVTMYAQSDEQALLAKIRYSRLIDIFTGVTCYSLQSHLRTTVPDIGQVETDEIYVGVDKRGAQFVFPVQAKGRNDRLGIAQIEQDFALCEDKFPQLICRPIAAQFMANDVIALFAFEIQDDDVRIIAEKQYKLVLPKDISDVDVARYRQRMDD